MRVLLAGIVGGLVAFFCGAFNHMVLDWGNRAFSHETLVWRCDPLPLMAPPTARTDAQGPRLQLAPLGAACLLFIFATEHRSSL